MTKPRTRMGINPTCTYFRVAGTANTIKLLREAASREPLLKKFIKAWDDAPQDYRRDYKAEMICRQAEIPTDEFRVLLVKVVSRYTAPLNRLKQVVASVDLTDKSLEVAKDKDAWDERKSHLQKVGVINEDKGGIQINQQTNINNRGLSDFEQLIHRLDGIERPALPEQKALPESVDAEFEEVTNGT